MDERGGGGRRSGKDNVQKTYPGMKYEIIKCGSAVDDIEVESDKKNV